MTTSEPTTGEIAEKLRQFATAWAKQKIIDDRDILLLADRLESQEREIEELKSEAIINALENAERIATLTARAEQAEADIKKFAHTSHTCGHNESGLCKLAADDHGFCEKCPAWVYRGLPQDGEGK